MGIFFELFIETENEAAMATMEAFWANYTTHLSSGETIVWDIAKDSPLDLCFWSRALGSSGVESYEHAARLSECGIDLAAKLVTSPEFVFARIGIEVDGYTRADFVSEFQENGKSWVPEGTIICKSLWEEIGKPADLCHFREGYYWNKYTGERINPVFHIPELYAKWKQLPGRLDNGR